MITFERVTEENLYIAKEMMDSNSSYFDNEYGISKNREEVLKLLTSNQGDYLIKAEDTYIGLTAFMEHKEEQLVTINLMIIHADYQGFGYGTTAYYELEDLFIKRGFKKTTLNVRSDNNRIKLFWERNGYTASEQDTSNEKDRVHYEKHLV
ncbi:GNAT family N-acetyltransferase [Bacillus sp. D386]|uniref:GNAT family N-acetyltransferase n=1 Tax=Bacillus sp. D386 TaxID=2587155 RepID=UPI001123CDE1|nr:GNAT family N-acetyltransferase [Bacillus sp. D386]